MASRPHRHVFRLAWLAPLRNGEPGEWFAMCKCGERIDIEQPREPYWRPSWPYSYPYITWTSTEPLPNVTTITAPNTSIGSVTYNALRCTCPPDRGDLYVGNCPVHDAQTTLTVENFTQ